MTLTKRTGDGAFAGILMISLLASAESSLRPSLSFQRGAAWWSPWILKRGFLSVADVIIVDIAVLSLFLLLRRRDAVTGRERSPYLTICGFAGFYLLIGVVYNLFVYTYWKTFFYDFKAVLYLTVPFLTLRLASPRVRGWFTPVRIFYLSALGGIIDWVFVRGGIEYPSHLGIPVVPALVPIGVAIVGALYSKRRFHQAVFVGLGLFEIVNAVNRLSLGILYEAAAALLLVAALRPRATLMMRFMFVGVALLSINIVQVWLVTSPSGAPLLNQKTAGATTRAIQMQNVLQNYGSNFPMVTGKGLGSTWFERTPVPREDIYSVGTSVGATGEESIGSPVKFIFNWAPASFLYKWGIAGGVGLIFLLTRFYQVIERRIRALGRMGASADDVRRLQALVVLSFLFAAQNFTFIGQLRASLTTSLLAFYVENEVRVVRAGLGGLSDSTRSAGGAVHSATSGATMPTASD